MIKGFARTISEAGHLKGGLPEIPRSSALRMSQNNADFRETIG